MTDPAQAARAARFRQLHHADSLLVLPNVWDALGACLLAGLGYPAVATASAAVAFSLGYDDGERVPFDELLHSVRRITRAVDLPVSVDFERGYAEGLDELRQRVLALLRTGAIGINLEDSDAAGHLRPVDAQAERIAAVREAASGAGIELVINARTDVFLGAVEIAGSDAETDAHRDAWERAATRGEAYRDAGADCFYPIGLAETGALRRLRDRVGLPLNVLVTAQTPDQETLRQAGVARLSLGPGWLRAAFTTMHEVAMDLLEGRNPTALQHSVTSDSIRRFLANELHQPDE